MLRRWIVDAFLLAVLAACRTPTAPAAPRASEGAKPARAGLAPQANVPAQASAHEERSAPSDLGEPAHQFLIHAESQQVVLRSRTALAQHVLVDHADAVLYQPALELVWFRDGEHLRVIDLGSEGAPVHTIARGMPDQHRLWIARGSEIADPNDGCDLPYVSLDWTHQPTLEPILTRAPNLRLDDAGWLAAELERPARPVLVKQGFFGKAVRIPRRAMECEDPADCGRTGPFAGDWMLVLVRDVLGGDCVERACLLFDAKTKRFATPPKAEKWGAAQQTAPGSCGPYHFDQSKLFFLVDRRLCELGRECSDVGGEALGWLLPGESVGSPGTGEFTE